MAQRGGDKRTMDLLRDWAPQAVAVAPRPEAHAAGMEARVAKAVAAVLDAFDGDREAAASAMSALLAVPVGKNALDAAASEARETHDIQFTRAWALAKVTGDLSVFALVVEDLGHVIIPRRYLHAVEDAMAAEAIERLKRQQAQARRAWTGGR